MSRFGKAISSTPVNIALFVIAAILLIGSVVGGTQAAMSYYSDTYLARLFASSIGVTLVENDNDVAYRNYNGEGLWFQVTEEASEDAKLLEDLQGQQIDLGKEYPEVLKVRNTTRGNLSEYVRLSVSKYWEDDQGNRINTVDPNLIQLQLTRDSGWMIDNGATTEERTIYYYDTVLKPNEATNALCSSISIDPKVASLVTQETNANGVTTIKYDYNGMRFCLEATAYAVQEHNAAEAIKSTWGTNVTIRNGKLSINQRQG